MSGDTSDVRVDLTSAARWGSLTVADFVERHNLNLSDRAVVFGDASRTYGELREMARRVAHALTGLGVEELDRVGVLTTNRLEFFEIQAGIAAALGIMVPLDWRLRDAELASLLRRSQARVVLVEDQLLPAILYLRRAGEIPDLRTVITLGTGPGDLSYEELIASSSAERPAQRGRLGDPHEITFTPVTVDDPPGVVWTNGTVLWNALQQVTDFGLSARHSTYTTADLCHISGRHDFAWPLLYQGGTVHVKPSSGFDAEEVLRYVAEQRITHVLWFPTMLYEVLRLPDLKAHDLSGLEMVMCGGQPMSAAMATRAHEAFPDADFVPIYGLAEGGCSVTFVPPGYGAAKAGSVGTPAAHVEVRVVDDEGFDVAADTEGEILLRAPSVTPGYWDDPELTERTIVDGWLHTGDLGQFDDDGFLYVSGRTDDVIVSGGLSVFPAEIESVLREHPGVADVAVIGIPDDKWGETVCAIVEAADGFLLDEQHLIDFCLRRLASYKKPTSVAIVDALPRAPNGDPRRPVLRKLLATSTKRTRRRAPVE